MPSSDGRRCVPAENSPLVSCTIGRADRKATSVRKSYNQYGPLNAARAKAGFSPFGQPLVDGISYRLYANCTTTLYAFLQCSRRVFHHPCRELRMLFIEELVQKGARSCAVVLPATSASVLHGLAWSTGSCLLRTEARLFRFLPSGKPFRTASRW